MIASKYEPIVAILPPPPPPPPQYLTLPSAWPCAPPASLLSPCPHASCWDALAAIAVCRCCSNSCVASQAAKQVWRSNVAVMNCCGEQQRQAVNYPKHKKRNTKHNDKLVAQESAHVVPLHAPIWGTHCGGRLSPSSCFIYAALTPARWSNSGSSVFSGNKMTCSLCRILGTCFLG